MELDFRVQLQTDPYLMPIENNGVLWPERLSPRVSVATIRMPKQVFDIPAQTAFARQLSYNPWHCDRRASAARQSESRAKADVLRRSRSLRQEMNGVPHYEPTGRRSLRVRRNDPAIELHGPRAGRPRARSRAPRDARGDEQRSRARRSRTTRTSRSGGSTSLHVARFVLLDDKTVGDIAIYGVKPSDFPLYLAFVGDIDTTRGSRFSPSSRMNAARVFVRSSRAASASTRRIRSELLRWMKRHSVASAANYVNWRGRTVRRAKEEAALADAIQSYLIQNGPTVCAQPARDVHDPAGVHARRDRRRPVDADAGARRRLSRGESRIFCISSAYRSRALVASPVLIPVGVIATLRLRALEKTDPELCGAVDQGYSNGLAEIEDHDVTNQFTAMGSLKPGLWRRLMALTAFFAIDYAARHLYTRGGLARVRTIHFARWVFLDGQQRVVFMSNYDGSLESYMDDFINKVGFGLNIAFGAGVGYPRTTWFALGGCGDERKFKEYLRRHQVPTQVWYKAYPGLTAVDLERNGRIRPDSTRPRSPIRRAREWVALL